MQRLTVLVLIICIAGCTTLQPIAGHPSDLQRRITSGEVLKRGDRVLIVTNDGRKHKFKVTSLSTGTIDGAHESISIDQVSSIERREFDVRKTVWLVALTVLGVVIVILAVGLHNGVGLPAGAA
jgi:hypothetical protein